MTAPSTNLYSSVRWHYLTSTSEYDIVANQLGPSRAIHVLVAGEITADRLDGSSLGPFPVQAGTALHIQCATITLGTGTEVLIET